MNRRGQSLLMAYVAVAALTVLGGALLNSGYNTYRQSRIDQLQSDAFYLAEGGMEDGIRQLLQGVANFQISPTASSWGPSVTTFAASTDFPGGATASTTVTEISPGQTTVTQPDGTVVFTKMYRITTTAQHPLNPTTTITLNQMINRRIIYTFQHAIFYTGDLEWLPGPNMTLSGNVHSNTDMYLGANTSLTVDTISLHAAGKIYNKRKDDGTIPPGVVQIKNALTGNFVAMNGYDSTAADWTTGAITKWGGTVESDVHGITQLAVPTVGSTQPGGFYDTNAGLKVNSDGNAITITKNGVVLNQGTDLPNNTVTVANTLYNFREAKWIQTLSIDMKKLAGYNNPADPSPTFPNQLPANGLLYTSATNTGTSEPAVRLKSGLQIYRTGGLTVVTNDPVYVQGDYNTVSKQPCAVIGDAANLLSNNWNDANSSNSNLNARTATNTTVDLAFIAGIKPTAGSQYSGGLENYPRLLENWSSKTLTISGSFVSLWNSAIATGNWVYGSPYYTAPTRSWSYDSSFSSGNLPPFTPMAVDMTTGAWWKQ